MKPMRNFPFFVPHAGCPNCCVFCSQTKITGEKCEKDINTELAELRNMLDAVKDGNENDRIAFFGGSFTAIAYERMTTLLETANEYIKQGVAGGIRISTRPDCIDSEILGVLKKYNVTNIEIGVQSVDDRVLASSARGHSAEDSYKAAELITKNGFVLCGQMMIGLPDSDLESELATAKAICAMGASEARIYPTVVFEDTELLSMTERGEYKPLSLDEAVERSAKCYRVFLEAGVKLLRIGLHSSENLKNAPYGANHAAIGELVKSRVYTDIICEAAGDCRGKKIIIGIRKEDISMLCGHKGSAIKRLKEQTGCADVEIVGSELGQFCPTVRIRSV